MKRVLGIAVVLAAATAFLVFGTGAGDSKDEYLVRAIFRNASFVIPGEDVKVAGVKVGKVKELDVSADQNAVVVLNITEPGFKDFRKDAECTIRPQSLIGEKFVECSPTQPRAVGKAPAPELDAIKRGEGKGQRLLPVGNTSRPVDIDLVGNALRLPFRQRLAVLLNEFGAAVAGRGEDLDQVIRKADPALKETDKVLKLLGDQNEVLAQLARNSDTVLAPLARDRNRVAGFIEHANTTAQATAERRRDLERSIQRLPEFLRQLQPTMQRLGGLSDQFTPTLQDLRRTAPQLNEFVQQLGPFSQASTPALQRLGKASDVGRKALTKSRPIIQDLRKFSTTAKPLALDLRALLESLRDSGGIERAMDYVFYQVAAINGFDALGHYLRAILVVNLCSTYAITNDPACTANFAGKGASAASARSARAALAEVKSDGRSPGLARLDAVLRGMTPSEALGRKPDAARSGKGNQQDALQMPTLLPGVGGGGGGGAQAPAPGAGTTTSPSTGTATTPAPSDTPAAPGAPPDPGTVSGLLDYLLGGG